MPSLSFGTPFLIPREILSEPEQKMFDEIKEKNTEEHAQRYKWWSMYDIMKFYGSGLIPKANAANFFPFKIDLTAPGLLQNKYRDADLVNGFNVAMNKLTNVSAAITDYYNKAQSKWTTETQKATLSAATSHGGSKKEKNKKSHKNTSKSNKKGGDSEAGITVDITKPINEIFSSDALKNQCTQALFDDVFHSRNRIFLVDNQLPTYTQPTYEQLRGNADKLGAEKAALKGAAAAPAAAPAAPAPAPAAPAAPAAAPAPAAAAPVAAAGGGKKKRKHKTQKNKNPNTKKVKKNKSRRL